MRLWPLLYQACGYCSSRGALPSLCHVPDYTVWSQRGACVWTTLPESLCATGTAWSWARDFSVALTIRTTSTPFMVTSNLLLPCLSATDG